MEEESNETPPGPPQRSLLLAMCVWAAVRDARGLAGACARLRVYESPALAWAMEEHDVGPYNLPALPEPSDDDSTISHAEAHMQRQRVRKAGCPARFGSCICVAELSQQSSISIFTRAPQKGDRSRGWACLCGKEMGSRRRGI